MPFDSDELQHILVSVIALSLAIAIAQFGLRSFIRATVLESVSALFLIFSTVGIGFVLHEMAHKFTAQRFGARAFYRSWPLGIFLMLLLPLIGSPFIFAAPGATYIFAYRFSRKQNGITSIAGPVTNLSLAMLFLLLGFFSAAFGSLAPLLQTLTSYGFTINLWLGFFNMIPIFPLDGSKVLAWDWRIWLAFTGLLGALLFF